MAGGTVAAREKAGGFWGLHRAGAPFVVFNPWDVGTARMFAGLGAEALATTSSGAAFSLGLPDMGNVSRDVMLAHCKTIAAATPLPVSADLENGYGASPEAVAETVLLCAQTGAVGCSIEDTDIRATDGCNAFGKTASDAYDFDLAVQRIKAAAEAARSLDFGFVLTARADGVMNGFYDAYEALRRLSAFSEAGADVLYAPCLPDWECLARFCAALEKPVNALAAGDFARASLRDFARAGVARVSVGGGFARLAQKVVRDAAKAVIGEGDFSLLAGGVSESEIDLLLRKGCGGY